MHLVFAALEPHLRSSEALKPVVCGIKIDEICLPGNTLLWDLLQDQNIVCTTAHLLDSYSYWKTDLFRVLRVRCFHCLMVVCGLHSLLMIDAVNWLEWMAITAHMKCSLISWNVTGSNAMSLSYITYITCIFVLVGFKKIKSNNNLWIFNAQEVKHAWVVVHGQLPGDQMGYVNC